MRLLLRLLIGLLTLLGGLAFAPPVPAQSVVTAIQAVPNGLDGFVAVYDTVSHRTAYRLSLEDGSEYWYKPPVGVLVATAPMVVRARNESELATIGDTITDYAATHGVDRNPRQAVEGWTGPAGDLKAIAQGQDCPADESGGWLQPKVGLDEGTKMLALAAIVVVAVALLVVLKPRK